MNSIQVNTIRLNLKYGSVTVYFFRFWQLNFEVDFDNDRPISMWQCQHYIFVSNFLFSHSIETTALDQRSNFRQKHVFYSFVALFKFLSLMR